MLRKLLPTSDRWFLATMALTVGLGLAVRLIGVSYDLPLITHPDEYRIINAVVDMFERRSFEPNEFTWPAHVVIMAGYLVGTAYSYLALGMGPELAISQVGIEHWYLSTRIAVALIGSAAIFIAYFIGRQINRSIGVIAAVLIAFYPPYVEQSHFATADMTLTTLVLALVLAAMKYLEKPNYTFLVLMSFIVAMAIATKYPGLIGAGLIALVVGVRAIQDKEWRRFLAHGFTSLGALGVSLFLVSPKLITERGMVFRSLSNESRPNHLGADGMTFSQKLMFYVDSYFETSGWLLLIPLLVGLAAIIRFRMINTLPIFVGVFFWISLSSLGLQWFRWGMPMFVTPLLISAIGIYFVIDALPRKLAKWRRGTTISVVAVSVVTTANLVATSVATSAVLLAPDTRAIAIDNFAQRGITPSNSVYEGYTPASPNFPHTIFDQFEQSATGLIPPEGIDYAVLSSDIYSRYQEDSRYLEEQQFYQLLDVQFELVEVYSPSGQRPESANPFINIYNQVGNVIAMTKDSMVDGPIIKVYRLAPSTDARR